MIHSSNINNLDIFKNEKAAIEFEQNPYEYYEVLEDEACSKNNITSKDLAFVNGIARHEFNNGYRISIVKTIPSECRECSLILFKNDAKVCTIDNVPEFGGIDYILSQIQNLDPSDDQFFKVSYTTEYLYDDSVENHCHIIQSNSNGILKEHVVNVDSLERLLGKIKIQISSIKNYLIDGNPWIAHC